ncbi:MAG: molybdenum-pterin-binding protein [Acidobacteria bacterium]|jgi:molybdopterin-binding protein|nr:MAG: molybdenum-pterin-binding protein [Acidobacteriota bacterium]
MNVIHGRVKRINSSNGLSEVEVQTNIGNIYSVVLEAPQEAEFMQEGRAVECIIKETSVVLLKEETPCINTFKGVVRSVERGSVLSFIRVECENLELKAVLLTRQVDTLDLSESHLIYVFLPPMQVALEVLRE